MSKNHYINLEKDDVLFVSSENGLATLYLYNGEGFERMISATKKEEPEDIISKAEFEAVTGSLSAAISRLAKEVKGLTKTHQIVIEAEEISGTIRGLNDDKNYQLLKENFKN